jgi:phosphate transport system substrate-binding protein
MSVYPISVSMAEAFLKKHPRVHITVGISGTGGGFKKLAQGAIEIANASRPIRPAEAELCKKNGIEAVAVHVGWDAIAVVIHKDNAWAKELTVEELKRIFEPAAEDKITKWNQVRKEWPDLEIKIFSPGGDSGTFDYFTEAIVGSAKKQRRDRTTFSQEDNVLLRGIANNKGAIGYMGFAHYANSKEKVNAVALATRKGDPHILPSREAIVSGKYRPLARSLYVYPRVDALLRPDVYGLVLFHLDNPKEAEEAKLVPLTPQQVEAERKKLAEAVKKAK